MEFTSELKLKSEYEDIDARAEVVREYSDEAPPKIRLLVTNRGNDPYDIYLGFTPPFSQYRLRSTEGQLVVLPLSYPNRNDEFSPSRTIDGCWTSSTVPSVLDTGKKTTLQSGDEIAESYEILNHRENSTCFPVGRYSTKDRISIDGDEDDSKLELLITVTESVQ